MQFKKYIIGVLLGVAMSIGILSASAQAAAIVDYSMPECKSLVIHKGLNTPLTEAQKTEFAGYLESRSNIFNKMWQKELEYGMINKKILDALVLAAAERQKFLLSEVQPMQLTAAQKEEFVQLYKSVANEQDSSTKSKLQKQMLTKAVEYGLMSANEGKAGETLLKEQIKMSQTKKEGMATREFAAQRKELITQLDEQLRMLNKMYLEKRLRMGSVDYKQRAEILSELDNHSLAILKKMSENSNSDTAQSVDTNTIYSGQICY